jgi:GrpB-like predicted nucleotidyltransferase (UPF0157 family)
LEQGQVGESFSHAKQRLLQLERRLQKQPEVRQAYNTFMSEYEQLGHMMAVQAGSSPKAKEVFYLPHHAVFKASSSTTRTRVVFDGSARSSNGLSLNETLMMGPTIQQDFAPLSYVFERVPLPFQPTFQKCIGRSMFIA